jgi:hypothetical protein
LGRKDRTTLAVPCGLPRYTVATIDVLLAPVDLSFDVNMIQISPKEDYIPPLVV